MSNPGPMAMRKLVTPMLLENFLRISISSVDIFMLSLYSQKAVAAVVLANQYAMFLMLVYSVVAGGAGIVLAQTLGAGRKEDASRLGTVSLILGSAFGLVMSLLMVCLAGSILSLYQLEREVRDYAWQFMVIYGGGSIFVCYNTVQAAILRTCGHALDSTLVNVTAMLLNILGNFVAIFGVSIGPFHLGVTGVAGVAAATVTSQAIACLLFSWRIRRRGEIKITMKGARTLPRTFFARVLKVGIPTAGEGLAYNIAQLILMNMNFTFGTVAVAAWGYNMTFMRYVFAGAMAISVATQIKVGHWVGAGEYLKAGRSVYRYYLAGTAISLLLVLLFNLFKAPLLGLLTNDPEAIRIASSLMTISIVLELGRAANLIVISALKGAGDVNFPVVVGMSSMWGIGVLGGGILGVVLGLGPAGIWAGVAMDESLRGVIMLLRWRSKVWMNKTLVRAQKLCEIEVTQEILP